jgi:sec-independent protein translocase protein TatA
MNALIIAGIIGPWQIVIVVALALLFFGGKKIPELMRGLGEGMKEFKKATKDVTNDTPQDQDKLKS